MPFFPQISQKPHQVWRTLKYFNICGYCIPNMILYAFWVLFFLGFRLEKTFLLVGNNVFTRNPFFDHFGWFMLMSASQSNGTRGCNSRAHNPCRPCHSIWLPINQLWHHCHLQQACWFPFKLAILAHLEQECFWKAAAFFQQLPEQMLFQAKTKKRVRMS